jgi:hypothetical protein
MRFNDDNVDIDGGIIDHLGKNELVVFVGAGVSSRAKKMQFKKRLTIPAGLRFP